MRPEQRFISLPINNNAITVDATDSLYDIWVQAQDSNTTCANVTNNTASAAAFAALRLRTVHAASNVILQGSGASAAAVMSADISRRNPQVNMSNH